ncbi:MAG: DUF2500 family protein [Agathobacter sp.]|nr:DUF2500 family protein [Agathobacter sp.]
MLLETMINGHGIWDNLWQVLLGLLIVGVLAIARYLPYWKPKGKVVECLATVKFKRMEYSNTPQIQYQGNRWNYLILFVDETGTEIELFTMEAIYADLKEGDIGKLKYQGDTILEFVKQTWYESPIKID